MAYENEISKILEACLGCRLFIFPNAGAPRVSTSFDKQHVTLIGTCTMGRGIISLASAGLPALRLDSNTRTLNAGFANVGKGRV